MSYDWPCALEACSGAVDQVLKRSAAGRAFAPILTLWLADGQLNTFPLLHHQDMEINLRHLEIIRTFAIAHTALGASLSSMGSITSTGAPVVCTALRHYGGCLASCRPVFYHPDGKFKAVGMEMLQVQEMRNATDGEFVLLDTILPPAQVTEEDRAEGRAILKRMGLDIMGEIPPCSTT